MDALVGPERAALMEKRVDERGLAVNNVGLAQEPDVTGWMAFYAIAMAGIAGALHWGSGRPASDLALKFLEHVAAINTAIDNQGMWDEADGMYYDQLLPAGRAAVPVKVRSMVGMPPLLALPIIDEELLGKSLALGKSFATFLRRRGVTTPEQLRVGRAAAR